MNGQQFLTDTAFRDAGNRVIRNLLAEFEELSGNELGAKIDTSVEFLGNDSIRKITEISYKKQIESISYTIGRSKFDKDILSKVCSEMEGKWVISVDESIVDDENFVGGIAYRHSCAFGYQIPDPKTPKRERILAVSSILRLQDEEDFESKMQFLPYLLNLYVAFYTAKILESYDEPVYSIILHGPLVRLISPFLNLLFRKEDIKKLLTADIQPTPDVDAEVKSIADGSLLDLIVQESYYKDSIDIFIDFFASDRQKQNEIQQRINDEEQIPGICIYFSLLRKLSDLANEMNFSLIGCVENADDSTEYSRLYVQYQIERFGQENSDNQTILRQLFEAYDVESSGKNFKDQFQEFIRKSGWGDEMIQSFSLKFDGEHSIESEFTNPVPIRRYFTTRTNKNIFQVEFGSSYISGDAREPSIANIIKTLFPFDNYRMLMSFVRTSELKAPIRVEFLGRGNAETWNDVLASIYVASLPYSSYGLPIFLYYADKMARMPKKITSTVTESYLLEQANRAFRQRGLDGSSLREVFFMVTKKLTRDFYNRG
ncbi:MAG: DNA double-strand break repair nuclease NurA [Candidatus Poribacteria bacterium]|nr:DNA double-strand break repair nuclease NurA [Candidatus Poribacteria bacterium]